MGAQMAAVADDQRRVSAGRHHADLVPLKHLPDPLDESVQHSCVAIDNAREHALLGILADQALGRPQGDIGQQRRPVAHGLQRHIHAGQEEAALIDPALGDHIDGGSGSHVNDDDGRLELLQRSHRIGDDVRAHLVLQRHPHIEARYRPRPYDDRLPPQESGQCPLQHGV